MNSEASDPVASLVDRVLAGESRAVARAISIVEDGGPEARRLSAALHPHAARAIQVGVTGAPGVGKSTVVSQLVGHYRRAGRRVGVLAVDPTSPFTGGALLGDRVRMQGYALDPDVFIRSLATRGQLGGLSAATMEAADVLDAAGFDLILLETVGVGQDEVDVVRVADVCIVVVAPGAGDDVQAMKAGVMEIADVFAVNKADRDGADQTFAHLEQMLAHDERSGRRRVDVIRVVATAGEGIAELAAAIDASHADRSMPDGRRVERAEWRVRQALSRAAVDRVKGSLGGDDAWRVLVEAVESRRHDPYTAAVRALADVVGELDHVGVATDALDETVALLGEALGLPVGASEDVPSQGVRVRFVGSGDTRIELVEALDDGSPFANSLRTRGPGLHHLALRVDDLEGTLETLASRGIRLIDRVGRPGAHGKTVAFVHPSATRGLLLELVEWPRG